MCFVEAIHIQTGEQLKSGINRRRAEDFAMMECACGIFGSLIQECRIRLIRQMFRVHPAVDCIFAASTYKSGKLLGLFWRTLRLHYTIRTASVYRELFRGTRSNCLLRGRRNYQTMHLKRRRDTGIFFAENIHFVPSCTKHHRIVMCEK